MPDSITLCRHWLWTVGSFSWFHSFSLNINYTLEVSNWDLAWEPSHLSHIGPKEVSGLERLLSNSCIFFSNHNYTSCLATKKSLCVLVFCNPHVYFIVTTMVINTKFSVTNDKLHCFPLWFSLDQWYPYNIWNHAKLYPKELR